MEGLLAQISYLVIPALENLREEVLLITISHKCTSYNPIAFTNDKLSSILKTLPM